MSKPGKSTGTCATTSVPVQTQDPCNFLSAPYCAPWQESEGGAVRMGGYMSQRNGQDELVSPDG
jgi:hypothetical protein